VCVCVHMCVLWSIGVAVCTQEQTPQLHHDALILTPPPGLFEGFDKISQEESVAYVQIFYAKKGV